MCNKNKNVKIVGRAIETTGCIINDWKMNTHNRNASVKIKNKNKNKKLKLKGEMYLKGEDETKA